ncbi:MAG: hypothetical protein OXT09_14540 [Myxococcales bacterium]|nr:hypothetical protein [Myxococcales bacterium]
MRRALAILWMLLWPALAAAQGLDLGLDAELDAELEGSEGEAELEADAELESETGSESDTESESESESESETETESEAETGSEDLGMGPELEAADGLDETSGRSVRVHSSVGLGFGTLSYERPSGGAVEILPETGFGAADISLGVHAWPQEGLSFDVLLAYQTSVGLTLELEPLFALPERAEARFQRGELSVAPVLRLGDSASDPAIALPVGFVVQFFEPIVHQHSLQRYTLGGPNARAELRLPLGDRVDLRVGPEAQWIVIINPGLADEGACCQGFAAGGQAAIEASVGPYFSAALAYRQSHAFAPAGAWRFKSVERFLTARIAGEL